MSLLIGLRMHNTCFAICMGEQIKKDRPVGQVLAHHDRRPAEHRLILRTVPDHLFPSLIPHHKQTAHVRARERSQRSSKTEFRNEGNTAEIEPHGLDREHFINCLRYVPFQAPGNEADFNGLQWARCSTAVSPSVEGQCISC